MLNYFMRLSCASFALFLLIGLPSAAFAEELQLRPYATNAACHVGLPILIHRDFPMLTDGKGNRDERQYWDYVRISSIPSAT